MARSTSASDTVMGWVGSIGGRMEVPGWGGGCFCLSASRVDSELSATESSEQIKRTAPLKSPSSNLADTLSARNFNWSSVQLFLEARRSVVVAGKGSASSLICLLMVDARDRRCPPLGGDRRQRVLNWRRRSQEVWSLVWTTASRIEVSFLPAGSREPLGILLMIFILKRVDGGGIVEDGWEDVESADGGPACTDGDRLPGGLRDPGQRAWTGPCCLTTPAEVRDIGRWQTAHPSSWPCTWDLNHWNQL